MISDLVTKVQALESKFDSQHMPLDQTESTISTQLSAHADNLQHALDLSIRELTLVSDLQTKKIAVIHSTVATQATTISSISTRFDVFESNLNTHMAPLDEAIKAGGLAALIQQTVLGCLNLTPAAQNHSATSTQGQLPIRSVDAELSRTPHTPRQLFGTAINAVTEASSAIKKRVHAPSPRKGQSSPMRARLHPPTSDSDSSMTDDL